LHFNKKVILIEKYNAQLKWGLSNCDDEEIESIDMFIILFFGRAFKGNIHTKKGLMTGGINNGNKGLDRLN